jgi:hypothetical protein
VQRHEQHHDQGCFNQDEQLHQGECRIHDRRLEPARDDEPRGGPAVVRQFTTASNGGAEVLAFTKFFGQYDTVVIQ